VGGLRYWTAGFVETSRAGAFDAVRRAAIGAGALVAYPTLIAQLVLAVNHLTAAVIRNPCVVDGLDFALGAAPTERGQNPSSYLVTHRQSLAEQVDARQSPVREARHPHRAGRREYGNLGH
jgi:hypothetical protein